MIAAILALCAGMYAWTADFPMVFDDHLYIEANPFLLDAGHFARLAHPADIVISAERLRIDPDIATNFIMRPVAYVTFRINVLLGGLEPRWFRIVNVVIHAANAALVFALIRELLGKGSASAGTAPSGSSAFIAAVASLLFTVHPLATESVTYIVQRFTSLGTFFYLAALFLYFVSVRTEKAAGLWKWRLPAMLAAALGMLTKESVFTLPLAAVMIDIVLNGTKVLQAARRAWPLLVFLPVVPLLVVATSMARHPGATGLAEAINLVNSSENPLRHREYLVTQITVVAAYLHRILWPTGLSISPDWPLHRSVLERPVLIAALELTALLAAVASVWRKHRDDARARLAFAGIFWFFLTVSVSSGLVPLPDLMAEHRSYLPSVGIFVLVACMLDAVRTSQRMPHGLRRMLTPVAALVCIAALAALTCVRNETWRTREKLWKDAVAKSPRNHRSWGSLGAAYADTGKDHEAVQCYREALRIEPRDQASMFNLSNSLLRLNQPHEALDTLRDLVETNQHAASDAPVAYTLGLAYARTGDLEHALPILNQVAKTTPGNGMVHIVLGRIYLSTNQPGAALEHFRAAAALNAPDERLLASIEAAESALATQISNQ